MAKTHSKKCVFVETGRKWERLFIKKEEQEREIPQNGREYDVFICCGCLQYRREQDGLSCIFRGQVLTGETETYEIRHLAVSDARWEEVPDLLVRGIGYAWSAIGENAFMP